jgi:hypothetical protein
MGLIARVWCNWTEAAKNNPYPFETGFHINEDGWPEFDFAEGSNKHDRFGQAWHRLVDWLNEVCDEAYVYQRIAGWGELAEFKWALEQVGWEEFPTFQREFERMHTSRPSSPEAAADLLAELGHFRQQTGIGYVNFLVLSEKGEVRRSYVPGIGLQPAFIMNASPGIDIGFDERGAFITERNSRPPRELFRSMRFEMRLLNPRPPSKEPPGLRYRVEYVAHDSEQRLVCDAPMVVDFYRRNEEGIWRVEHSALPLHVEKRLVGAEHFDWLVANFERVCRAAVETGNPIYWSR